MLSITTLYLRDQFKTHLGGGVTHWWFLRTWRRLRGGNAPSLRSHVLEPDREAHRGKAKHAEQKFPVERMPGPPTQPCKATDEDGSATGDFYDIQPEGHSRLVASFQPVGYAKEEKRGGGTPQCPALASVTRTDAADEEQTD